MIKFGKKKKIDIKAEIYMYNKTNCFNININSLVTTNPFFENLKSIIKEIQKTQNIPLNYILKSDNITKYHYHYCNGLRIKIITLNE